MYIFIFDQDSYSLFFDKNLNVNYQLINMELTIN